MHSICIFIAIVSASIALALPSPAIPAARIDFARRSALVGHLRSDARSGGSLIWRFLNCSIPMTTGGSMSRPTASAIALLAFSFSLQAQGPAPAPAGLVTGVGNFTHIVENMDRSLAFYRDALGLEPNNIRPDFSSNPGITKMLGAPATVQSKVSTLK